MSREKVITINDWWDGPLQGLAEYQGDVYIYERVFDEAADEYDNEYALTPVSKEEEAAIMREWAAWCHAVETDTCKAYAREHNYKYAIDAVLKASACRGSIRKKARFSGAVAHGFLPVDYFVEWFD